jgi:GDP-L-fucose synthase
MEHYEGREWLNIGTGEDLSIRELAELVCAVVGYEGKLAWDTTKPDGTPRKLLDVSKIHALGWKARIGLRAGIEGVYAAVRHTF